MANACNLSCLEFMSRNVAAFSVRELGNLKKNVSVGRF